MDNDDDSPRDILEALKGMLNPARGFFMINWIGEEVQGFMHRPHVMTGGRRNQAPEQDSATGLTEAFFPRPRRRIILLDQVSTIIDHEKGAVIRLGYESLIVAENFTELAATIFGGAKGGARGS